MAIKYLKRRWPGEPYRDHPFHIGDMVVVDGVRRFFHAVVKAVRYSDPMDKEIPVSMKHIVYDVEPIDVLGSDEFKDGWHEWLLKPAEPLFAAIVKSNQGANTKPV